MSNSNTPNEPERIPETSARAVVPEASASAEKSIADLDEYLAARLRTFLKDCGCPCCSARARLRTLREASYDRAEHSSADIHCASSDRRNYNADSIREIVVSCVVDCLAALHPRQRSEWFRETIDAAAASKAVRAAAPNYNETDTNAR